MTYARRFDGRSLGKFTATLLVLMVLPVCAPPCLGAEPAEAPLEPTVVAAKLPFTPTRVLADDETIYISDGRNLAHMERSSPKDGFVGLVADELEMANAVAARGGLVFIAPRTKTQAVVLDRKGEVKRRIALDAPAASLAVDDLENVYVFTLFPNSDQTKKAFFSVYDRSGLTTHTAGAVNVDTTHDGPAAQIDQMTERGRLMPLVRTDTHGRVWALLRDGSKALRFGPSGPADEFTLPSAEASKDGAETAAEPKKESEANKEEERKRTQAAIDQVVKARPDLKDKLRVDNPNTTFQSIQPTPEVFRDFACGGDGCVAVYRQTLEPKGSKTSVRLLTFDARKHAAKKTISLTGSPEEVVGVATWKGRFFLYAKKGSALLEYELDSL